MNAPIDDLNEQLSALLEHMGKINASDLYLIAGHPPVFRVDDVSYPARVPLEPDDVAAMAGSLMIADERDADDLATELSVAFSWLGDRFRATIFSQRGALSMVVRRMSPLRTLEALSLSHLQGLARIERGLVLIAGGKRSGRSTTLAALIDHRNAAQPGHILTIEDPIEQLHEHKQSIVTQREIGRDTRSYASALGTAPSLAPDAICVDAITDAPTAQALLALAGAGYACFSTLHAQSPVEALEQLVRSFTPERHAEIRVRLAQSLRAVIGQRLMPAAQGRTAAVELLLDTPENRELIRAGDFAALARVLERESAARSRDSGRAASLRLAPDVYEPPLAPGERRSKVGGPGR